MRNAQTILGLIRERGRKGLPLERVYRLLFNRDLYLCAYGRIYRNAGAMTPGATEKPWMEWLSKRLMPSLTPCVRNGIGGLLSGESTLRRNTQQRNALWGFRHGRINCCK